MNRSYTAYIEWDSESDMYIGSVPGIAGARTFAKTLDELQLKLKEVISLCLECMETRICQGHCYVKFYAK